MSDIHKNGIVGTRCGYIVETSEVMNEGGTNISV